MIIKIKAKSLKGACELIRNRGYSRILHAVRRGGVWEVTPL